MGIAATSVYIHFADRDALVLAALEHCHAGLLRAVDDAESGAADPVAALRARAALLGAWSREHPGLYKVLHEHAQPAHGHVLQGGWPSARPRRSAAAWTPGWRRAATR